MAHSDLTDYLTADGYLRVRNLKELPPQITKAIKKLKFHRVVREVRDNEGNIKMEVAKEDCEFELYDKKAALEALGKEIGMFVDRKEFTGKDGQPLVPQGSTKIVFDFGVDEEVG